ncbi:MAG: hypothetical protein JO272_14095 [Pseudonocardiales bacterium]|nr:hypothetical protein [Pseudonocardiales bacterium]
MAEGATASASRENRRAIPVTCAVHRGPRGFANLVVERKDNGDILLDPHVTGECVIILDEAAAMALFDVLGAWLRRASTRRAGWASPRTPLAAG